MLVVLLAGCGSAGGDSSLPAPSPSASGPSAPPIAAAVNITPSPTTPTPTPGPTPTPTPTPTATGGAAPRTLGPDTVAVVVTDDLVMRSEPEISKSSVVFKPWLQRRVQLYVLAGPVRASGFEWYEVMPLAAKYEGVGWVAAASRSGEPWIKPATAAPDCPPAPGTIADVLRLSPGRLLACFSGVPITLRVVTASCGPELSDAMHDPDLFNPVYDPRTEDPYVIQLGDPGTDPCEELPAFQLYLDPAGATPAQVPIGDVVAVTGAFDHPAAADCLFVSLIEGPPVPDPESCRTKFVVTRVE